MDEFSQAMTQNGSKKAQGLVDVDKEISQTLDKAHKMNDKIWQETHPAEYKAQLEKEAKQKKDEEQYALDAQQKMNQLKEEVNVNIDEFLKTSEAIKEETAQKEKMLKKLKKKYKHIKHKHEKLQHKLQKKAEDEALIEATEQVEMETR